MSPRLPGASCRGPGWAFPLPAGQEVPKQGWHLVPSTQACSAARDFPGQPQPGLRSQARAYRAPGEPCREVAVSPRRRRYSSAAPTSRPRVLAGGAPARGGGPERLAAPWPPLIGLCGLRSRAWPMGSGRVEVTGLGPHPHSPWGQGPAGEQSVVGRGGDGRGMKGRNQWMSGSVLADPPCLHKFSWAN